MNLRCVFSPLSLGLSTMALGALLSSAACSSSSSSSTSTTTSGSGGGTGESGVVPGAEDTHCGSKSQAVSQAACTDPGTGGSTGAGGSATGSGGGGGMEESEYGATLFNAEGDDDDCKYHLKWTATGVAENQDVTFTLVVTTKTDGKPATGAAADIEAFLNDTHPAPNSDQKSTEGPGGTYKIGPMRFDAAGQWTVRFHLYETCLDGSEESPHGHGAFFFKVP